MEDEGLSVQLFNGEFPLIVTLRIADIQCINEGDCIASYALVLIGDKGPHKVSWKWQGLLKVTGLYELQFAYGMHFSH